MELMFGTCQRHDVTRYFLNSQRHEVSEPNCLTVSDQMYRLQYSDPFSSDLFMETNNLPQYSLENALNNLFLDPQLNYQHCLLTVDCNTVAIFKTADGKMWKMCANFC